MLKEQMSKGFTATQSVTIAASPERVWDALTNPEVVRLYMHGTELSSDWKVGSSITWRGSWKGKSYEDKGTVLDLVVPSLLRHTYWSSMGGGEDQPDNYRTVTYHLQAEGDATGLTVTQDNNPTQAAADQMAEANWAPVLRGLKEAVER